jgi:hypothetical protein
MEAIVKFDYELYHPKKVFKDIQTSFSSYYKSKDVHVSPMTKIGDAAKLHGTVRGRVPERISRRKPIFTRSFNRQRLAFGQGSQHNRTSELLERKSLPHLKGSLTAASKYPISRPADYQ